MDVGSVGAIVTVPVTDAVARNYQGGFMSMKQVLDKGLNKIISRKLLSWITASTFLCLGFINNEQWTAITIGYVGIQGFADLAATWKHGK